MESSAFRIEPLKRNHDRSTFSCGEPLLDRYLQQQARQDMAKRAAVVYVLLDVERDRIAGYYTLNAHMIALDSIPADFRGKLPRYPNVPATLLGRLAVDSSYRGQHLGNGLLFDALRRVQSASHEIATWALLVDALNDGARSFYEHYGFLRLEDDPYRLFLPLSLFESLLAQPEQH